jgi:hypothetical protein
VTPTRNDAEAEIVQLTQKLLRSIAEGDWKTYSELCDPELTAFESEARGHLVQGMAFHEFYFNLGGGSRPSNTTICAPHVWMLGPDAAVIAYVRIVQRLDASDSPVSSRSEETRVWRRRDGGWKHVHFHRSANS